jgi:hypothetical protein
VTRVTQEEYVQDTTRRSEEPERIPPGAGDYFVIQTRESSWFYVSTVMARAIDRRLDRWLRPRWITFVDVTGARIRIRAADIVSMVQSTAMQRADRRAFDRECGQEDRADRDWDTPF